MTAAEFTINAPPGTDVWRKPPTTDVFNAPRHPPPSTSSTGTLAAFHSARLSFLLPSPSTLTQYDQGGLLLSLTPHNHQAPTATSSPPKWIKTGVEVYNGLGRAATVACDAFADWSLAPVSMPQPGQGGGDAAWITVEVESATDELGESLWVYQIVGEDRVPLREVCWPFGHGGAAAWDLKVEAYACRPSKTTEEDLKVEFRDFKVQWAA